MDEAIILLIQLYIKQFGINWLISISITVLLCLMVGLITFFASSVFDRAKLTIGSYFTKTRPGLMSLGSLLGFTFSFLVTICLDAYFGIED
jgi:hypothetical protein